MQREALNKFEDYISSTCGLTQDVCLNLKMFKQTTSSKITNTTV